MPGALLAVDHGLRIRSQAKVVERAVSSDNGSSRTTIHVDHLNRLTSTIFDSIKQSSRIRTPNHASHIAIQRLRHFLGFSIGAVHHHQAPTIRLVTRSALRQPSQTFSVRGINRTSIGTKSRSNPLRIAAIGQHRV